MGAEEAFKAWLTSVKRWREPSTAADHQPQPDRAAALGAPGALGEALVAGVLRDMGWPVLRNVVLCERGRSTEIDVIARAPGALVVLEVKTWSGFIDGTAEDAAWTRHSRGEVVTMPQCDDAEPSPCPGR